MYIAEKVRPLLILRYTSMRIQDGALGAPSPFEFFLGLFLQMLNASLHVCNVLIYILSLQKQRGMKTPKILPRRRSRF